MRMLTLVGLLVAGLLSISTIHAHSLTTQQKYDALAAKGIFSGIVGTQPDLDANIMDRAQFARVAALLLGLDASTAPTTTTFTDVPVSQWAAVDVQWVAASGVIGDAGTLFQPGDSGDVTIEQLARLITETLGLDVDPNAQVSGASDWAQGYVNAVIKAGLLPASGDYTQAATRADLIAAAFNARQGTETATQSAATASTDSNGSAGESGPVDLSGPLDFINQQPVPVPTAPTSPATIANLNQTVATLIPAPGSGLGDTAGIPPTQIALADNNTGNEVMMDDLLKQAIDRQNNGTLTGFYAGGFTGHGGAVTGAIQLNAELGGGSSMFDGWMDFKTGGSGRMELLDIGTSPAGIFANSGSSSGTGVLIGGESVNLMSISGEFFGANADGDWMWQGAGGGAGGGTFNATYQ